VSSYIATPNAAEIGKATEAKPVDPAADPNMPTSSTDVPIIATGINLAAENEQQLVGLINTAREFGLSDRDAQMLAAGPVTVTQGVHDQYAILKGQLMADKAWVARYMDGGQQERALMMECNARLVADVVP
jgi:hypothetical protein